MEKPATPRWFPDVPSLSVGLTRFLLLLRNSLPVRVESSEKKGKPHKKMDRPSSFTSSAFFQMHLPDEKKERKVIASPACNFPVRENSCACGLAHSFIHRVCPSCGVSQQMPSQPKLKAFCCTVFKTEHLSHACSTIFQFLSHKFHSHQGAAYRFLCGGSRGQKSRALCSIIFLLTFAKAFIVLLSPLPFFLGGMCVHVSVSLGWLCTIECVRLHLYMLYI